jgi:hypothetical protein
MALKTGIFISVQKRVGIENKRRGIMGLPLMTDDEALQHVTSSPMHLLENMSVEEFEKVYCQCRKITTPTFKKIRADKKVQLAKDLERKEDQVRQQEKRETRALQRFKDRENFFVYKTMAELQTEFKAKHPTGSPKYSTAMKSEIVVAQLQYRRDCLNRVFAPGALCSNFKGTAEAKLRALTQNFKACIKDEANPILPPPLLFSSRPIGHTYFFLSLSPSPLPPLLYTNRRGYHRCSSHLAYEESTTRTCLLRS